MLLALFAFYACEDRPAYNFFSAIEGVVYDASSGEPLSDASVVLMPGSCTQKTGKDGSFNFSELETGQYTISVQKKGYYVDRKSVTAISGEIVHIDILLSKI